MRMNNMNRTIISLIVIGILTVNIFGCSGDSNDDEGKAKPEFYGEWVYDNSKAAWGAESITFTVTDYVFESVSSGTFEADIISYDEESDHILGTVIKDDFLGYTPGDSVYLTYEITDGIRLDIALDKTDYPATAGSIGHFIKE
jgi:hypothetical protein